MTEPHKVNVEADVNLKPNAPMTPPSTTPGPTDWAVSMAQLRGELGQLRIEWDTGHKALIERVTQLEAWQTWVMRIVLALVITAIVGTVITGTMLGASR